MDSGSPTCKRWALPNLQSLYVLSGNQGKGASDRLLQGDMYGNRHVRSALPSWATPSYLQDIVYRLLKSICGDFGCHLYNVAQFDPCRGVEE